MAFCLGKEGKDHSPFILSLFFMEGRGEKWDFAFQIKETSFLTDCNVIY